MVPSSFVMEGVCGYGNKRAKWTLKEDAGFRFQKEEEESVRKSLLLACPLIGGAKRVELNAFRVSKRI